MIEMLKIKQTNLFILSIGSHIFSNKSGAIPSDFAYVYKIVSGFIAKTGKLMPMKDPVVTNFFRTNLIIFD
jgi:hypothetical protein